MLIVFAVTYGFLTLAGAEVSDPFLFFGLSMVIVPLTVLFSAMIALFRTLPMYVMATICSVLTLIAMVGVGLLTDFFA